MVLVLIALAGFLFALKRNHYARALDAEYRRKIVHVGMGFITLSFPWVFREAWPVVALAVFSSLLLWSARRIQTMQRNFGGVLDAVPRQTWGEIYFALSVALIFWLARGDAILFCVPMLVLTFADAGAALIGVHYGKNRYSTSNGAKSVQGSLAFFVITALILLAASNRYVLFATSGGIVWACVAAAGLTLIEAIAPNGWDNFLLPLGTFACLKFVA